MKVHGIHEGHWRIKLQFDTVAAQMEVNGVSFHTMGSFAPIVGMDLVKMPQADDYTVDAAIVNPKPAEAPLESRILVQH